MSVSSDEPEPAEEPTGEVDGFKLPVDVQPGILPGNLNGAVQDADRISWNSRYYYEQAGEDIVEVATAGFVMTAGQGREPYARSLRLTQKQSLDTGFVERASLISIQNNTKWKGQFLPTEEQKKAVADSRVLIWLGDRLLGSLAPTQQQHFWNCSELAEALLIEPVGENVRVKVVLFPE